MILARKVIMNGLTELDMEVISIGMIRSQMISGGKRIAFRCEDTTENGTINIARGKCLIYVKVTMVSNEFIDTRFKSVELYISFPNKISFLSLKD